MKLKKRLKFSDSNQVWRIKITDTDKLFIETRDTEKMKAYYHAFELNSGRKIFSDYQMTEMFWLGVETIKEDIVFFHRFAKPDMPGHKGIFAFDINEQKILWENEAYAFLFVKDDLLYVYQDGFEGRYYYTIEIETGKVLDELVQNHDEINFLRNEAELSVDYSNYVFPERYTSIGESNVDELIACNTKGLEIASGIDFIIKDDLLIYNFHEINKTGKLTNKLFAYNSLDKKEIYSLVLNKSANAYAPDSFFVYKNFVILLKEKSEVIVLEIKG
jgi:hypothetical protein